MSTVSELDSKIAYFFVRVGSSTANRKDLDGSEPREDEDSNINLDIRIEPAAQSIRISINLALEDAYAKYRALVSGEWTSEEDEAFRKAIDESDPSLEELIMTILAPQILSVAQTKILDLARSIDCPVSVFPYSLSREIRASRPRSTSQGEKKEN